jgi:lipopolysaccharide transport system permease protein
MVTMPNLPRKLLTPFAAMFALWRYRGFIGNSVAREFQVRYRNSLLGAFWNVINPLALILVYTVIFANVMRAKLPGIEGDFAYSIFLCSGVLTWSLLSELINKAQTMFIDNANLLKKIHFPLSSLLLIAALNALLNFLIIFFFFLAFLVITKSFPGWEILGVLPVLVLQIFFAVGLGLILSVLNVFFRDVGQFFAIFLQFWFWLTPVVYPFAILPEAIQAYVALNPMTPVVMAYQTIFVMHQWPDWRSLLPSVICAVIFCVLGFRLFTKHAGEMADEL